MRQAGGLGCTVSVRGRVQGRDRDQDEREGFVTLVEFDEALRQAVSEADRTLEVTGAFSHGEDKRKKFDLR